MKITGISFDHKYGGVTIDWVTKNGHDFLEHTMESSDKPQPDFINTLAGFAPMVVDMLKLPQGYEHKLRVNKLSIKHLGNDKDGRYLGLTIACTKELPHLNSPFNIVTPYVTENEGKDKSVMPMDMSAQLQHMLGLALNYMNGDRIKQQPDLPLEDVSEDTAKDIAVASDLVAVGEEGRSMALYPQAVIAVFKSKKASTSWLQREMKIGYNLAAFLMEKLQENGIVSAPNHIGKRELMPHAEVAVKEYLDASL